MIVQWQIYRKVRGNWMTVRKPMSKEEARSIVADMRSRLTDEQFREEQPHCVPL